MTSLPMTRTTASTATAVPPRTRGDLAFLLHMLAVTNAQGMVGVVMPHGVLFRGGAEGKIRRGIVGADLFEAVIGLAPTSSLGPASPWPSAC